MLFPTVEYLLFFLAALLLSWGTLRIHSAHKITLLVLSYFFYGFWDWHFLPLLLGISAWGWIATRGIQHGVFPRFWLAAGVIGCLAILGYYKYTGFVLATVVQLAAGYGISLTLDLESPFLPLGISFMTFHAISLMMDALRGKLDERVSLLDALLYVSFFPQLIAGPILRASNFLPQLRRPPDPRRIDASRGLLLITAGLFKKVVIANSLATLLVDDVFANPAAMSASQVLLGIYGYAAQIYCDFSGYTDIAIGCALLLGYRFPDNFNAPYKAASPREFWHRWHISLSSWLRDYLYISLGGSRVSRWRTNVNLMVTMILGGLWHGAAWNFVLWGGLHGGMLVVHRQWDHFWRLREDRWRRSNAWLWISRLLLFHAVCLGWVFFRADFGSAVAVLERLWTGTWHLDLPTGPLLAVIVGISAQYLPARLPVRLQLTGTRWHPVLRGAAVAVLITMCEILGPSDPAPFIYFQF